MQPRRVSPEGRQLFRLRRATRDALREQLDVLLSSPTDLFGSTPEHPRVGPVLDDIVLRQLVGYGFSVSLSVQHPSQGTAEGDRVASPLVLPSGPLQ